MDTQEENRIIAEVMDGNADAYGLLVKRYERPIYNLMMRMTSSAEDALDLSQEAFLKAYEKLDKFKTGSRFFPWLYAIGMNLARDFLRKKKAQTVSTEELLVEEGELRVEAGQEKELMLNISLEELSSALVKLPDDYREALILRYHKEMSMREVAVALDISVSGAKMRVHRGLIKLRDKLIDS